MIHTLDVITPLLEYQYRSLLRAYDEREDIGNWYTKAFSSTGISELALTSINEANYHGYHLRLRINPSFLIARHGNINAVVDPNAVFDETDFAELIPAFNECVAEIVGFTVPSFEYWNAWRIDYLADAIINNSPIRPEAHYYIQLAKSGLLPQQSKLDESFVDRISYLAENKSCKVSLYHRGPAVRSIYFGLDESTYLAADKVLRLEVQCLARRLKSLADSYSLPNRQIQHFLTRPDIGLAELSRQASRIFDYHDYYSLNKAAPKITKSNFQQRTKDDLRNFLKSIQTAGGLKAAQKKWKKGEPIEYRFNERRFPDMVFSSTQVRRIITQVRQLQMNPVPLPLRKDKSKPAPFPKGLVQHPFPALVSEALTGRG